MIIRLFLLLAPMRGPDLAAGDKRQPAGLMSAFLILEKDAPGFEELNARVLTAKIKQRVLKKRRNEACAERRLFLRKRVGDKDPLGVGLFAQGGREGRGLLGVQKGRVAGFRKSHAD